MRTTRSRAHGECRTGPAAGSRRVPLSLALGTAVLLAAGAASAAEVYFPIVVPVTGFMSVEGGSQRNGAVMAMERRRPGSRPSARLRHRHLSHRRGDRP